jgi:ribonuclease HI
MDNCGEKRKIYAVHKGRTPGLYFSWEACREQVDRFEGAVFKKFSTVPAAKQFVTDGPADKKNQSKKKKEDPDVRMVHLRDFDTVVKNIPDDDFEIVYVTGGTKRDKDGFLCGGYNVYFSEDDPRNIKESFKLINPTPQRCELMGMIRALEIVPTDKPLIICTKSEYVYNIFSHWIHYWMNHNWRTKDGKEVKNKGLIERMWHLANEPADRVVSLCLDKNIPI